MKRVYAFFMMMVATCGWASAQTTIYAYRTFQRHVQEEQTEEQLGPVKFDTKDPSKVTLIANQSKQGKVYAGTYYNYKWYAQVTQHGTQSAIEGLYTIDMKNGSRTLIAKGGTRVTEMTVDYTTGTVYGVKGDGMHLVTIDLNTGATKEVGDFNIPDDGSMLALACSLDGKMYGISTDDNFYTINKTTGQATLVGPTGVNAAFIQAMDFDRNTGELYWANTGTYSLYKVDVATGKATLIGAIGEKGDDSVQGLFIPFINVAKGAPDRVVNRTISTEGTTVNISWTNPTVDAQGQALTDFQKVLVYRDGEKIAEVVGEAGANEQYADKNVVEGQHTYDLVPVNSKGEGGKDTDPLKVMVGDDRPGAVGNLKVETGDSKAVISWTTPTKGMTGGTFKPEDVAGYKIWRSGTKDVLATLTADQTTYTDTPKFGKYTYTVCAFDKTGDGVLATTPEVMVKPADWIVMTTGTQKVETGKTYKFYDPQGPNNYYKNSLTDTLTIMPTSKDAYIKCAFTLFSTDTYGDFLYIYNGASVDAPLIGEFTSETVPEPLKSLESTSTDGALTFVFSSDIMSRAEGWEAEVTAVDKLQNDLSAGVFTGSRTPKVNEASVYTLNVTNKGIASVAPTDYKVALKDASGAVLAETAGIALKTMECGNVTLSYAPATANKVQVYAEIEYAEDKNMENNKSNVLSLNVLSEDNSLVDIRKSTADDEYGVSVVPMSFMSNESVSETIYYKDEINLPAGKLESIIYYFLNVGTAYKDTPLKIYIGETDKADLTEGAIPANQLQLVFDGTIDANKDNLDLVIPLTTPYDYKGGNLVVMVYKKSDNGTSYDVSFKGIYGNSETDPKRCKFDSTFDDTETLDINADFGYSASTNLADTSLLFSGIGSTGVKQVNIGGDVRISINPINNELFISEVCDAVSVYDFAGQQLISISNTNSVDMSNLSAGIYLVKMTTANGKTLTKKIIKK